MESKAKLMSILSNLRKKQCNIIGEYTNMPYYEREKTLVCFYKN
nr:hypothetical protein [Prevotella pallens]